MERQSRKSIAIVWDTAPGSGTIEVSLGRIEQAKIAHGKGCVAGREFSLTSEGPTRLEVSFAECCLAAGATPTLVQICSPKSPVTVALRDVNALSPVFVPEYGVAITEASDPRGYDEIAASVRARGAVSELQRITSEPEETFEYAAARNRSMVCPTWLGISRDMRIFRIIHDETFGYWGYVVPAFQSYQATLPETDNQPYSLHFVLGPGASCKVDITRRLEDGVLPIVRSVQREGDMQYHLTAFATLETRMLSAEGVRGSDWQATYAKTLGNMYSADDKERLKGLIEKETIGREEELVCCVRVEAVNSGMVPRHAWFKGMHTNPVKPHRFDADQGFATVGTERVYAVQRLNGAALPNEELAVLLQPGEKAVLEILIPHQPISQARARALAKLDIDAHLGACRSYWRAKLASAAKVGVPEAGVRERIEAGLLHLDINTFGREPDGETLACVGWYAPIGSESAPMIQFYDSMGWHRLAERSLDFFLARQREDGFVQNFGGYQLETGPFLWTAGEHYRYTRDEEWVKHVKAKLLKSCEYLLAWRRRNMREELRGKGYGLLDGKVADPDDFFHSFMLNALSFQGVQRVAEMLESVDPPESRRLAREAAEFREDIRTAYYESLARSPVVPLGDGTWAPAPPPWTDYRGPLALFAEGGNWFTHGAFGARDSLIGPLHLVIAEVLSPEEIGTTFLLKTHHELFTVENAGRSQPYYCRHDYIHLKRGEVKEFLKTWYNQFSSLQDRETYTFWEHYFRASQHKTHEEAWFLMQTRWMLWLEEAGTLTFLKGIPRRWMEPGKRIELRKIATYFGPASLTVVSRPEDGSVEATVECISDRKPGEVTIRLPHPKALKARLVEGGIYEPKSETVRIRGFTGSARVVVHW